MPSPIVRFAPSPTGRIHIGHARTALLNWVFAKQRGGSFVLRFDDTDVVRSREEYAIGIEQDLRWLGIVPDVAVRQSARRAVYDHAMQQLQASGRLYRAYETVDELDRRRKRQIARGAPPIYDRAARNLSEAQRAQLESEGRRPHWRFLLHATTVVWEDLVRGTCHVDCASLFRPGARARRWRLSLYVTVRCRRYRDED
jgi:glutamyl-tRNA synthetase